MLQLYDLRGVSAMVFLRAVPNIICLLNVNTTLSPRLSLLMYDFTLFFFFFVLVTFSVIRWGYLCSSF